MIFMASGSLKYLDDVSARFTARFIFCEMAIGNRWRVA